MVPQKILITTGDTDGIGLEVTTKALQTLGPQKGRIFILFRALGASKKIFTRLEKSFERVVVQDLEQAFDEFVQMQAAGDLSENILFDIASSLPPPRWVELAARACLEKRAAAMVTGPLSKTCIQEAGLKDIGHTDILKRLSRVRSAHMGFVGEFFNVVLATGHIPLASVPQALSVEVLGEALVNANALRLSLPANRRKMPIGWIGLNPHAGEEGLLGDEERLLTPRLHRFAKARDIPLVGPLVPDAAFLKKNWSAFSVYLALYHDQGLIPFKAIHGQDSGVHITLGIPFVRTSVDHGTAKDLFGKDKANANSMQEAILWAAKLARKT